MKYLVKPVLVLAVAFIAIELTGCATPATIKGMTIRSVAPASTSSPLTGEVTVGTVNGGSTTNPMWTSEISNVHFGKALKNSLQSASLLATSSSGANYSLAADLLAVDQPVGGFTLSVMMRVRYLLKNLMTNQVVYNKIIHSRGTASMGDAFFGVKRLRLANEEAARKNIAKLIKKLRQLEMEKNPL